MGGILGQLQTMLPTLANAKPDSEEPKPLISKQYLYESILHMSDSDILKNQQWINQESEALLEEAKAAKDEAAPEDEDEDLEDVIGNEFDKRSGVDAALLGSMIAKTMAG
jgi:hypothetical protein